MIGVVISSVSGQNQPRVCEATITPTQHSPITAQQCTTSAGPTHDERRASGAHSSGVK